MDQIREEVISGFLAPATRVPLAETATRLRMSQIPLREALRGLCAEGWLVSTPQRGYRVTKLSIEDLDDTYSVRILLESHAAQLAVEHMSTENIDTLRNAFDRLRHAYGPTVSWQDHAKAHRDFHFAIYKPSRSPIMLDLLTQLWQKSGRYQRVSPLFRSEIGRRVERHEMLLKSAISGNSNGLITVLREHLEETRGRVRHLFEMEAQERAR